MTRPRRGVSSRRSRNIYEEADKVCQGMRFIGGCENPDVDAPECGIRRRNDFLPPREVETAFALSASLYAKRQPVGTRPMLRQKIFRHPASEQARTKFVHVICALSCSTQRRQERNRNNGQRDQHLD